MATIAALTFHLNMVLPGSGLSPPLVRLIATYARSEHQLLLMLGGTDPRDKYRQSRATRVLPYYYDPHVDTWHVVPTTGTKPTRPGVVASTIPQVVEHLTMLDWDRLVMYANGVGTYELPLLAVIRCITEQKRLAAMSLAERKKVVYKVDDKKADFLGDHEVKAVSSEEKGVCMQNWNGAACPVPTNFAPYSNEISAHLTVGYWHHFQYGVCVLSRDLRLKDPPLQCTYFPDKRRLRRAGITVYKGQLVVAGGYNEEFVGRGFSRVSSDTVYSVPISPEGALDSKEFSSTTFAPLSKQEPNTRGSTGHTIVPYLHVVNGVLYALEQSAKPCRDYNGEPEHEAYNYMYRYNDDERVWIPCSPLPSRTDFASVAF
ncbi:Hypothetical protein POVN_LOCUS242 [uncultured virus]|nr:Hypothetical protein POVN_LOCUS242 [uncultured virus]